MMIDDRVEESSTVRKVYVLPRELADRIIAFQQHKKLPSEVEAVRRLLDEALLHRDTPDSLLKRFAARLEADAMPASVAKDVLVGHPLIEQIGFPDPESVTFVMKGAGKFSIDSAASAHRLEHNSWVSYYYSDEIPF